MARQMTSSQFHKSKSLKNKYMLGDEGEITGYMKDVLDELEDRPEEVIDFYGAESKEQRKFIAQYERQQKVEEELFVRAPRTKEDKKREKRLKSRTGLHGLTEGFDDEFKFLEDGEHPSSSSGRKNGGKFKRRKSSGGGAEPSQVLMYSKIRDLLQGYNLSPKVDPQSNERHPFRSNP